MTSPSHVDDDRGCLRLVLAVPFVLLTLIAAYFRRTALTIQPSGPWDDDAYAGVVLSCALTIGAADAATALWVLPPVRRGMRWWWAGPALLLGVIATARWAMGSRARCVVLYAPVLVPCVPSVRASRKGQTGPLGDQVGLRSSRKAIVLAWRARRRRRGCRPRSRCGSRSAAPVGSASAVGPGQAGRW